MKDHNGEVTNLTEVLESNVKLIEFAISAFKVRDQLSFEDLRQAGTIGLVHAARTFDASKGKTWASWAVLHIRDEAKREVAGMSAQYNGSVHRFRTRGDILTIMDSAVVAGKTLTEEEIAAEAGVSVTNLRSLIAESSLSVDADPNLLADLSQTGHQDQRDLADYAQALVAQKGSALEFGIHVLSHKNLNPEADLRAYELAEFFGVRRQRINVK